jgi:hypothetical protein
VTHHEIKTLEDGTRVYSNGTRYKPLPLDQRKKGVNKPDDPRAVRFHGEWFLPLPVLPLDARKNFPQTRPDSQAYDHMPRPCKCIVCRRPASVIGRWQRKWRRDHGLRA